MPGSASDEWRRTYELASGGEVAITNRNGGIEVQGANTTSVEVRASRSVHAASQKTADSILPKIEIAEDVTPGHVTVRTKGVEGIIVGVSYEVMYHVTVPNGTNVRLQTANGDVTAGDITGRLVASATNGKVRGVRLAGGVELRNTNGPIDAEVSAVGLDPISIRTTNGAISLVLPVAANGNLQAATTANGTIDLTGLTFEPIGDPGPERGRQRRVRGRLNAGGTPIDLQTVNGNISVSAR